MSTHEFVWWEYLPLADLRGSEPPQGAINAISATGTRKAQEGHSAGRVFEVSEYHREQE